MTTSSPARPPKIQGQKTAVILDGCAIVQGLGKPRKAITWQDYAEAFYKRVEYEFGDADVRCTAWDRYWRITMKKGTRAARVGKKVTGVPTTIMMKKKIPNWKKFIADESNKVHHHHHHQGFIAK